ncbi:hypothetical protein EA58_06610 [Photobacterium galatheae]|uniref:Uncharacterized protein n=3 Tax=Photobacterium galatheae TaxID=1654360 RepID=A0A066RPJ3_9GAMM|nr:hypothetical protein EA58_06610 [Photobacterium galatheae]
MHKNSTDHVAFLLTMQNNFVNHDSTLSHSEKSEMMMKKLLYIMMVMTPLMTKADPWSTPTRIQWLYPTNKGLVFGTQDYANQTFSSCDAGKRFIIPRTHDNYAVMSSTMIAAFMADKKIKMNIDGEQFNQPVCEPSINRFLVFK